MSHTPGPWRVAENEWNTRLIPWTGAVQIEGDVSANWNVPPLVCVTYRGDCSDADARLIAAAPDMLEALRECEHHTDTYETVRAAIAKATGGERK